MKPFVLSVLPLALAALIGCGDDSTSPSQTSSSSNVSSSSQALSSGASSSSVEAFKPQVLDSTLAWFGEHRATLNQMMEMHGKASSKYDSAKKPIALFDFDNTMIQNDIGDQTTFYMIANNLILQPAAKDWSKVSPLLTADARTALNAACDAQAEVGKPLNTNGKDAASQACADELFEIYYNGKTKGGKAAYGSEYDSKKMEPAYALTVQFQAGYTPAEMKDISAKAIAFATGNAVDAVQTLGTNASVPAWVKTPAQIKDLVTKLQNNGFDVWITTASSQWVVKSFAGQYGIAEDHVIGVRATLADGKLTSVFEGCGAEVDGTTSMINYRMGKRCFINKVILGASTADQDKRTKDLQDRVVFAAGDSDTDLEFLKESKFKLVFNRSKTELMCNAYNQTEGGNWMISPLLIKERAQKSGGFDCSKYSLPNVAMDTVYTFKK
jgi:phosphoserine phosphatase